jgi:hypothetical protein
MGVWLYLEWKLLKEDKMNQQIFSITKIRSFEFVQSFEFVKTRES